jgi:two-component system cell cycle sensor histidine kinase/response regulator CckA
MKASRLRVTAGSTVRSLGGRNGRLLWVVVFVALALHAALGTFQLGSDTLARLLMAAVMMSAGALALARPSEDRVERAGRTILAAAAIAYALGELYFYLFENAVLPHFPTVSDLLWLSLLPAVVATVAVWARGRSRAHALSLWLDGAIVAVGLAALASQIVFEGVVAGATSSSSVVGGFVAYPIGDLAAAALLIAACGAAGWRVSRGLLVLIAGFLILFVTDTVNLYQIANNSYGPRSVVDSGWPAGIALIGLGLWLGARPQAARVARYGWRSLMVPTVAMLVAVGMLVNEVSQNQQGAVFYLAIGAVMLMVARLFVSLQENVQNSDRLRVARDRFANAEARYRQLVERIPGVTYVAAPGANGEWLYVSPQIEALLGYSPQQWCEDSTLWHRSIHPDDRERVVAAEEHSRATGEPFSDLYRLCGSDGREVWVSDEATAVSGDDGAPALEGIMVDVTERKLAETAADYARVRLADAQAIARVGSWEWDLGKDIVHWSDEAFRIFGLDPQAFSPSFDGFLEKVHPDDRERVKQNSWKAFEDHGSTQHDYRIVRPDGEVRKVEGRSSVVVDDGGEPVKMFGTVQDVTDQRHAEEALRESEAAKAAILDTAIDCVITMDGEGRIREFNHAAEKTFRYSREQALGRTVAELIIPPELRDSHNVAFARATGNPDKPLGSRRHELVGMRSDGTRFPVEISISRISSDPPAFAGIMRDITERKRSEQELHERAERQQAVAELGRAAVADMELPELMHRATFALAEMLGTEFVKVLELMPSGDELILRSAAGLDESLVNVAKIPVSTDTQAGYTLRARSPVVVEDIAAETRFTGVTLLDHEHAVSGLSVPIEDKQGPVGVLSTHTAQRRAFTEADGQFVQSVANVLGAAITRERAEDLGQQLELSQRLETVGKLAGGVAHDFNNLLSVILNYARFAIEELDPESPIRADVAEIEKAGIRAAELTRQLLIFSRREVVVPEILDVNAIVADMEQLLRRTLGEHIDLRATLCDELARVKMGPNQLEHVIVNLAINARDAMPEGGELVIRTDGVELDAALPRPGFVIEPGSYVRLTVSDTGIGMTEDVRAHAFEPFFTTKGRGKGTGLGLATVYGAVKQAGGYVNIDSEPGHGTVIRVYLPATQDEVSKAPVAKELTPRGHGERVLLVEDEEAVRASTKRILVEHGYTVTDVASGEAAINLIRRLEQPPHLVLADVVMPGMSGRALGERLELLAPGLRTIYMSGYTDDMISRHGFIEDGVTLLEKPFSVNALLDRVRATLGAPPVPEQSGNGSMR